MQRRPRAWYLATASALAVATAPHAVAAAGSHALTDDDLFLVSLKLGNLMLADSVTAYQTADGLCLDLQQTMQALDFPIDVDPHAGFARGWFLHESQRFALDIRQKRVEISGVSSALDPRDVQETAEGLCVSLAALKRWFPINFTADLSNAQVRLVSREALPIEQQIERRARQVRLQRVTDASLMPSSALKLPYEYFRPPALDATAEIISERSTSGAISSKRSYTLVAAGEIAKLSSEVFVSSNTRGIPQDVRARLYRRSSEPTLLGRLRATEFVVGDVNGRSSSLIAEPEAGRGASITNIPLDAPQTFDRTTFRGDIPDGWEVELYRNGQLANFIQATSNGRYEFRDVPLIFGLNNFEIVAYGPQGQIKRDSRSVTVGPQAVPPGQFWYAAGAYDAGRNLISLSNASFNPNIRGARGFASVQYGATPTLTLGLNVETLEFRRRQHSYLEATGFKTINGLVVGANATLDLQGGQAFEVLAFGNTLGMDLSTRHALFNRYTSQRITDLVKSRHALRVYSAPTLFGRPLPMTFDLVYDRRRAAPDLLDLTSRVNWAFRGMVFAHESRFTQTLGGGPVRHDTRWLNSLLWNAGWEDFRLRGELNYRLTQGVALERINTGIDWYQSEQLQVRGQAEWAPAARSWRVGLGFNRLFEAFSLGVRGEVGSRGALTFGINIASGLSPGRNQTTGQPTWAFSRYRPALTGSAAVHVFEDSNDNGRQDSDELPLSGVGFAAGSGQSNAVSDARGMVQIEALRPFFPQSLAIDTATLPDSSYRAKFAAIAVSPRPGVSQPVEYPVYPTGDVDGVLRVRKGDTLVATGGARVQVLDASGALVAAAKSDFEGYFIVEGLKYGRYMLRVDPAQAQSLGFASSAARLVEISRQRPSLSGQDLVLVPEGEAAPRLIPVALWAN